MKPLPRQFSFSNNQTANFSEISDSILSAPLLSLQTMLPLRPFKSLRSARLHFLPTGQPEYQHFITTDLPLGDRGSTVVKVLCYKSEGRWFDPSWCQWNFSLTLSFRSHYGPGVDSASNINEYQEYFRGVKAAGA